MVRERRARTRKGQPPNPPPPPPKRLCINERPVTTGRFSSRGPQQPAIPKQLKDSLYKMFSDLSVSATATRASLIRFREEVDALIISLDEFIDDE